MAIVSLSVRYTSATIDEFIENHAPDVSARGIYIKTERDIPLGTLIDFDVRIAGNQTVLAGAGRVMWTRTVADATPERPAGIGVRFIELEEASSKLLARLLGERSDAGQKYMEEPEVAMSRVPTPPPSGTVIERSAPSMPPQPPGPTRRPSSRPKAPARAARRSLPPVAPPPRRPTLPPRASTPPSSGSESAEDTDRTQAGPLPPMPKGRNATLVGLGAPVLPRVTTPPRRRSSKPPPAAAAKTTPTTAKAASSPPAATAPLPPATPPPPKTASLPPKPTPPPPRVSATTSHTGRAKPSPPPPAPLAGLDDVPEEPTLLQPMAALEREASPSHEPAPGPERERAPAPAATPRDQVPIEVDLDVPDAEPTVIAPRDDAEPTVIVPRESPIPLPSVSATADAAPEQTTEVTAPQSMKEILGADAEPPRDLGDTQRVRRRGRKRRVAALGVVVLGGAAAAAVFALTRRPPPTAPEAPPSALAAMTPPSDVPGASGGALSETEGGADAADDRSEGTPEASADGPIMLAPSSARVASSRPAPQPASTAALPVAASPTTSDNPPSTPAPVPIEFSAMAIERVHPPRPPRKGVAAEGPPASQAPASAPPSAPAQPTAATQPAPAAQPAAGAPNCNPTYTVDADGNKHFKPECFK